MRFGDRRVQALFSVLVLFSLQARAFMRALLAQLLGLDPTHYPPGRDECNVSFKLTHVLLLRCHFFMEH
ncbi:MAG: hypothetical protein ACREX9_06405 [Gammaproteobacteria bacterium]